MGPILSESKPADLEAAMALKSAAFGGQSVAEKQTELIGKIGENISFSRFDGNSKIGVVVILSSNKAEALSSDSAAELGKDLAMQIAAFNPLAVDRSGVPADLVAKEKEIYADHR